MYACGRRSTSPSRCHRARWPGPRSCGDGFVQLVVDGGRRHRSQPAGAVVERRHGEQGQRVAGVQRQGHAVLGVQRRSAVAQLAAVLDVVMDEEGVVHQLQRGGDGEGVVERATERLARCEQQRRAEVLGGACRVVADEVVQLGDRLAAGERGIGGPLDDGAVHPQSSRLAPRGPDGQHDPDDVGDPFDVQRPDVVAHRRGVVGRGHDLDCSRRPGRQRGDDARHDASRGACVVGPPIGRDVEGDQLELGRRSCCAPTRRCAPRRPVPPRRDRRGRRRRSGGAARPASSTPPAARLEPSRSTRAPITASPRARGRRPRSARRPPARPTGRRPRCTPR